MSEDTVTRDDLADKFKEVLGEGAGAGASGALGSLGSRAAGALGIFMALIMGVYLLGRRRGRKKRTIVEIKRI